MKNSKQVNIAGYNLTLTERTAYEQRDLEEYAVKHAGVLTNLTHTKLLCVKIINSLGWEYKKISWLNFRKKLVYKKAMNVKWLMKNLSSTEIYELDEIIDNLEDYEKKKAQRAKVLAA